MNKDAPPRRTLADIIMEKLTEKRTEVASQMSGRWTVSLEAACRLPSLGWIFHPCHQRSDFACTCRY